MKEEWDWCMFVKNSESLEQPAEEAADLRGGGVGVEVCKVRSVSTRSAARNRHSNRCYAPISGPGMLETMSISCAFLNAGRLV